MKFPEAFPPGGNPKLIRFHLKESIDPYNQYGKFAIYAKEINSLNSGHFSRFRTSELAFLLNRMRSLKVLQKEFGPQG